MPVGFLSDAEREKLNRFPTEIVPADLIKHFTLTPSDLAQIPQTSAAQNRLGFALLILRR
jgi:hypothetical protein